MTIKKVPKDMAHLQNNQKPFPVPSPCRAFYKVSEERYPLLHTAVNNQTGSERLGLRHIEKTGAILNLTFCTLGLMQRTKKGFEELSVAIKE